MKKFHIILLIVCCLLWFLIILRGLGIVDINFYQSMLSSQYSASKSQVNPGKEKNFSYHVTLKYKDKTLDSHFHLYDTNSPVEILAELDKVSYSGNYFLPLIKNFKMTYLCNIKTLESSNKNKVVGKIEGVVEGKIFGFCSRAKAKEIVFNEAKKNITSYTNKLD